MAEFTVSEVIDGDTFKVKNGWRWDNKTGFPLELKDSKFLIDNGYYVANNLYYIDKVESKGRELYIRALKQK